MVKDAVATVLALNRYSFKVHEVFSNVIPELLLIEELVQGYGGHIELHPEIKRILKDLEDSQDTDMNANEEVGSDQCVSQKPDLDQDVGEYVEEHSDGEGAKDRGEKSVLCPSKNSKDHRRSYNLTLVIKSFLYHKDDFLSYLNPMALIKNIWLTT